MFVVLFFLFNSLKNVANFVVLVDDTNTIQTYIPQPEAAIDSTECQHRLLEHIQKQQTLAMTRLQSIEARVIGEYRETYIVNFPDYSIRDEHLLALIVNI